MKSIKFFYGGRKTAVAFIAALSLLSCDSGKEPVKLGFQDIYGRQDWAVQDNYPSGYFYIENSRDMAVEKLSGSSPDSRAEVSGETDETTNRPDSYRITLTGPEPSFSTQRLLSPMSSGVVASFVYTSTAPLEGSITLENLDGRTTSKIVALEQTSVEKEYSFDLEYLISDIGWGGTASMFNIAFGQSDGAVLTIKDIQVRPRNNSELAFLESFFFTEFTNEGNSRTSDVTEYRTPGMLAVKITPVNAGVSFNTQSQEITQQLPRAYSKLSFDFKVDNPDVANPQLHFWYSAQSENGRGVIDPSSGLVLSGSEWQSVTIDLNATAPGPGAFMNAGNFANGYLNNLWTIPEIPLPRRLRVDFEAGLHNAGSVYFRSMRLHD